MPVPPHAALSPNTPVAIILKQDQPTGRQVTGLVSQILTRGDHPRGVKVRLTDGRVGRVQRVLDAVPSNTTTNIPASVPVDDSERAGAGAFDGGYDHHDKGATATSPTRGGRRGRGDRGRGRGGKPWREAAGPAPRNGDGEERADAAFDLTAFIKDGRGKGGKRRQSQQSQQGATGGDSVPEVGTVRCPVCGEFEGDERAVQHHVESHFS
ncbi:hypothetical protein Dda_4806 [Drechslerella dactyloides]|uniref:UBZ4-type domain-containing protein n=1 Tax=Drechslerella dactyloides TaxID=74499 RepID=A0AAD6IZU3_DREDA|nr:hypothetical protein Dda_4806 [Drechslerella dactyloides]